MANEINAVAGQLWGVPVGQVYTAGAGIVIDNVHKTVRVGDLAWEDITSSALTTSDTGAKLLYNPYTKQCMFTLMETRNLSANTNAIGTVSSAYRPTTGPMPAAVYLANNKYIRGWIATDGSIALVVSEAMTNVGIRFQVTWIVGQ